MEHDWIAVFSTGNYYRAHFAKELLSNQDIEAIIINKTDSGMLHPSGYVEVFIRREDLIRAMYLLKTAHFE
jgi:hypothetical protein